MQNKIARVTFTKEFELDPENYRNVVFPNNLPEHDNTEERDLTDPQEMMEFEKYLLDEGDVEIMDVLDYGSTDVDVTWELLDPADPKAKTATDAEMPFLAITSAANDAGSSDPKDAGAKAEDAGAAADEDYS